MAIILPSSWVAVTCLLNHQRPNALPWELIFPPRITTTCNFVFHCSELAPFWSPNPCSVPCGPLDQNPASDHKFASCLTLNSIETLWKIESEERRWGDGEDLQKPQVRYSRDSCVSNRHCGCFSSMRHSQQWQRYCVDKDEQARLKAWQIQNMEIVQ